MISRKLPDEIIIYILLELDMADILRCRTVSQRMDACIRTSSAIQYKIELAANGLEACAGAACAPAAALRRLREQQRAWRHCAWAAEARVELGAGCRTYELRSGVWAFGHGAAGGECTTAITCCTLPPAGGARWTLAGLGLAIRDFTMDPLLDLLVLVEQAPDDVACPFRIHIRRLSDGRPHEMAARPVLDFDMASSNRIFCTFGVQLYGAHVGVLVRQDAESGNYDYMGVWNWRTGAAEMYMEAATCSFDDFAFIDAWTIMLAVLRHPCALEVWRFGDTPGPHEKPRAVFVGCFMMPLTTPNHAYLDMHFDGSPALSLAGAKTLDGTPFAPGPEPHIFAISFGVIETTPALDEPEVAGFTMVMRPRLMLAALARAPGTQLLWDAWGPACTRWLELAPENLNWEPCAFGGRYAVVGPRSGGAQVIQLFDFRPDVLAQCQSGLLDGVARRQRSVVPKRAMFAYDVVSDLPYHVATSADIPTQVSGVMIDEGRLVCTKMELDDEWRTLLVLSF